MKKFNSIFTLSIFLVSFIFLSCKTTPVSTAVPATEYERSIGNIQTDETITYDTFEADKKAILKTINELSIIMNSQNYNAWLGYVTNESKAYWSQRSNLKNLSLPVKSITLKSLEDYFRFVFCPSRQGKRIDEIRYISSTNVKAVQVNEDHDTVYYTFVKENGKWLLDLEH